MSDLFLQPICLKVYWLRTDQNIDKRAPSALFCLYRMLMLTSRRTSPERAKRTELSSFRIVPITLITH